jgi:hypothetical protein
MLQGRPGAKGRDTAVEMALDPEEIDFDSETMALKAEAALRSTSFFIIILPVLRIGIRDPVLFLPRDPGWVENQDPVSGSGMNNPDQISKSLKKFLLG